MSSEEFSLMESLLAAASLKFGNHFGDVLSYISKIKLLEATVRLLWQIMMSSKNLISISMQLPSG